MLQLLKATIAEAEQAMSSIKGEELLKKRRIQGFDVTGMEAILHSVSHFRGHTQEIVHMTRCQLGDSYLYDFIPSSPEQGAPPA